MDETEMVCYTQDQRPLRHLANEWVTLTSLLLLLRDAIRGHDAEG